MEAGVSTEDANQKFLRSLPSAWSQVSLIMRTKPGVDSLSFDDLYNNLRVFESDIKGSTASSSSSQNVAFVSENTSTLLISLYRFITAGRKLQFDAKEPVGFDKTKVECYNCHKTGHFARECRIKGTQDNRRRDAWNSRNKDGSRTGQKEDSKALVTIDGEGVDWTNHSEDEDYALMACNSSDSDTELSWIDVECQLRSGLMLLSLKSNEFDSEDDSNIVKKPKVDKKFWGIVFTVRHVLFGVVLIILIRDCDFHEKRMARKADLNNGWNNVQRVNKQNQFVPSAVLTRTGKIPVNTAKASSTKNFSTARQSFNRQTILTSTAMKVNTVKPIVNRVRPANVFYKTHSPSSRPFKKTTVLRTDFSKQKVNMLGGPVAFGGSKGYFHCLLDQENQAILHAGQLEANKNAGTEDCMMHVGDSKKRDESAQDALLKRQEKEAHEEAEALRKKFEQETENLVIQEGAAKTSSTNIFSTVSTPAKASSTNLVNTVSIPGLYCVLMRDYLFLDQTNPEGKIILKYLHLRLFIYIILLMVLFTTSSYDDEGAVADFTNLESVVNVSPIPTSRIHSSHPTTLILGDPTSAVQTRSKLHKSSGAHAFVSYVQKQRRNNHKDFQHCLFACFLFKHETLEDFRSLEDENLPFGKKAIGTKWVYRNKKDERGVVVRNKARKIDEGKYMCSQPPGFLDPKFPRKYTKFVKALYGYIKLPRSWYATLSTFLLKKWLPEDRNLGVMSLRHLMKSRFQMSSMGELTFFLGLQVKLRRRMVLYLFRPDIMFAVCACSRFQVTPKSSHLSAVKRIFSKGYVAVQVFILWAEAALKEPDSVLLKIHTDDNVADLLTKAFDVSSDLLFDDADGIDSLPNQAIFDAIQLMGHLDAKKKFVMYPRFISIFLDKQLANVSVPLDHFPVNTLTSKVFSFMVKKGKHFSGKVTPLFATMLVQPTQDEGAPSERPSEAQPTPSPAPTSEVPNEPQTDSSPAQTSEVPIEQQTDLSPRPSPTPIIPDSIPETSGENLGGHSSSDKSLSGNEGDMTLQSVYDLCLSLCAQVSDQAKEIQLLKAQITKLKKQAKPVIKHHRAWLKSVSLKQRLHRKSFSKKQRVPKESVSKQGRKFAKGESSVQGNPLFDEIPEDTVDHMETENAQDEGRTREMVDEDKEIDENILSTEDVLSTDKEVPMNKLKDIEETDRPRPTSTRSLMTLKPLLKIDPKDRGKKKIEEDDESKSEFDNIPEAKKKFKQIESDEEMARKIQEEWEGEEERNIIAEEKA
ncbi:ribonuclease H-like domain-containing protein, partial [Tanacetum coccineum]